EVRAGHRFDEAKLDAWLEAHVTGARGPLIVRQFKGGQSNPTFFVAKGDRGFALRKKPPGALLPSAHQVEREYRVLRALEGTDVPVAKVHALCEDESVVGTPFYVMDYVQGRIFWDPRLPGLSKEERRAIYEEEVRVLAAIHAVDVDAVGLGDYGRKGEYVSRQVARWSKQYLASATRDIPAMNALMAYLPANVRRTTRRRSRMATSASTTSSSTPPSRACSPSSTGSSPRWGTRSATSRTRACSTT